MVGTVLGSVVLSAILGGLIWLLMWNVIVGLRTGRMGHSDSSSYVARDRNPVFFWALTAFFVSLAVFFLAGWTELVCSARIQ